jgi:hypothetical protein
MNIFVLDKDPIKAAQYHCDRHMKMILETAQMFSTCIRYLGVDDAKLYRKFNPKHPCNLWLMESRENARWLYSMAIQLNKENEKRYGKTHKSIGVIEYCYQYLSVFADTPMTKFKLAMFPQFMTEDPIHSYRMFYAGAKAQFASWKINTPDWWDEYRFLVQQNGLEVANEKDDGVKIAS